MVSCKNLDSIQIFPSSSTFAGMIHSIAISILLATSLTSSILASIRIQSAFDKLDFKGTALITVEIAF